MFCCVVSSSDCSKDLDACCTRLVSALHKVLTWSDDIKFKRRLPDQASSRTLIDKLDECLKVRSLYCQFVCVQYALLFRWLSLWFCLCDYSMTATQERQKNFVLLCCISGTVCLSFLSLFCRNIAKQCAYENRQWTRWQTGNLTSRSTLLTVAWSAQALRRT